MFFSLHAWHDAHFSKIFFTAPINFLDCYYVKVYYVASLNIELVNVFSCESLSSWSPIFSLFIEFSYDDGLGDLENGIHYICNEWFIDSWLDDWALYLPWMLVQLFQLTKCCSQKWASEYFEGGWVECSLQWLLIRPPISPLYQVRWCFKFLWSGTRLSVAKLYIKCHDLHFVFKVRKVGLLLDPIMATSFLLRVIKIGLSNLRQFA